MGITASIQYSPEDHHERDVSFLGTVAATAGVYLAGAVTPGPNFLYVAHTASASSRRSALLAAFGVASGSATLATIYVLLIGDLFSTHGIAGRILRLLCGLYLGYMGLRILRALRFTDRPTDTPVALSGPQAYLRGFLTIVANPKAMLFFGVLTTTILPFSVPLPTRVSAVAALAVLAFSWYSLIAITFSSKSIQVAYRRIRLPVDLLSGCFFIALGLYIAFTP
ncbi:LysE family translocator [Amycolatopsis sp. WAC 04197]|uniref:LysE family translocator n=1 Tax=Amycolatopsis sp. WAC 04197 TaxID=2203199 RepID=UPI0013150ED7|nr:LysE family transporter [Amycolatopsis sp. WAC 04197]